MSWRRIAWTLFIMAWGAAPIFSLNDTYSYSDPHAGPIQRVCVLPVDAQLNKVGFKGGEALHQESEAWAGELGDAVKHAIREAGGEIADDLTPQVLEGKEQLRESVIQVQQRFATIALQMNRKSREVAKGRYSLGDEVALLPCAARADSLLFIHSEGFLLTDGRKALTALTSGAASFITARSKFKLRLTFVDSTSGSVKALILVSSLGEKSRNDPDEAYGKDLGKEFAKLHVGAGTPGRTAAFSINLATAQTVRKSGEHVVVHATLVNRSSRKMRLVSEKSAWFDFQIEMRDAAGNLMKIIAGSVGSGGGGQVSSLLPGKTAEFDLTLSDIYDLKAPGEYSVEFHRPDEQSKAIVSSNKVTIAVTN